MVLALLSAFLTFVVLTGLTPIVPTHEIVITFLGINSATILLLLTIIGAEVWQVVQARRRGRAASRLHVQIVALFSVIAVLPAVLVAAVANITLDRGLDRLFNTRTKAVIENSVVVAHAYVQENARQIAGDMIAMANELARARPLLDQDRDSFRRYFHVRRPGAQPACRHADRQGPQRSWSRHRSASTRPSLRRLSRKS